MSDYYEKNRERMLRYQRERREREKQRLLTRKKESCKDILTRYLIHFPYLRYIVSVFLFLLMVGCNEKMTNPERYKGSVVMSMEKTKWGYFKVFIKLPLEIADSIGEDYIWIRVPVEEQYNLKEGDTIQ